MDANNKTEVTEKTAEQTEAERKKAFEAEEAKRKAEFDAKKAARDEEIQIEWEMNTMLSTDELLKQAENNIATGVERITHRNMKESVAAYIIELSRKNENLSRNILHPKKSVANCFKYIPSRQIEAAACRACKSAAAQGSSRACKRDNKVLSPFARCIFIC